ncbi:uncharacterized protein C8A04DRAFT_28895 [Dichotomopilus funicola]|uniref:Uncharacterized protein n=1 Tax=Dichotomopilus funicola TaxID=1934379 RepID=A0AAN6ZML3_9PEZI|nr:hypothetical protein C8A04DRAFT_28895 [Dichotomopilus funicola]
MANFKTPILISALGKNASSTISRLAFHTPYGLVVEETADGVFDVRLSNPPSNSEQATKSNPSQPGYRYYFWPDYQLAFVFYELDWAGNPEDESHVDDEVLEERYGKVWFQALDDWVKRYEQAFEREDCKPDSHEALFPDPTDRLAWDLDRVLLAAWLALQPGVDSVEVQDDGGRKELLLEKEGIGETLGTYLRGL